MDCRVTLGIKETFEEIITTAYSRGEIVNLLVDDNGLARAEGTVIHLENGNAGVVLELDSGARLSLDKIVAVNGVFLPDYGEC